jgi:hypothetical protein
MTLTYSSRSVRRQGSGRSGSGSRGEGCASRRHESCFGPAQAGRNRACGYGRDDLKGWKSATKQGLDLTPLGTPASEATVLLLVCIELNLKRLSPTCSTKWLPRRGGFQSLCLAGRFRCRRRGCSQKVACSVIISREECKLVQENIVLHSVPAD